MKKLGRWLGLPAIAVLGALQSPSEAAFITSIQGSTVTNVDFITSGAVTDNDDTATTPNFASFDLGVNNTVPVNADIGMQSPQPTTGNPQSPPGPFTEYAFTVNVTNNLASVLDVLSIAVTNQNPLLLAAPNFDTEDTPALAAARITDQLIRFTGLGIAPGASQTITFWMDLPDVNYINGSPTPGSAFPGYSLTFATVPEPASMALAGLACCGIGGLVRRRRKAAAAKTEVA